jgi:hypothetical protein
MIQELFGQTVRDLVVIANVHSGRLFFLPSTSSLFISGSPQCLRPITAVAV